MVVEEQESHADNWMAASVKAMSKTCHFVCFRLFVEKYGSNASTTKPGFAFAEFFFFFDVQTVQSVATTLVGL